MRRSVFVVVVVWSGGQRQEGAIAGVFRHAESISAWAAQGARRSCYVRFHLYIAACSSYSRLLAPLASHRLAPLASPCCEAMFAWVVPLPGGAIIVVPVGGNGLSASDLLGTGLGGFGNGPSFGGGGGGFGAGAFQSAGEGDVGGGAALDGKGNDGRGPPPPGGCNANAFGTYYVHGTLTPDGPPPESESPLGGGDGVGGGPPLDGGGGAGGGSPLVGCSANTFGTYDIRGPDGPPPESPWLMSQAARGALPSSAEPMEDTHLESGTAAVERPAAASRGPIHTRRSRSRTPDRQVDTE